MVRRKSVRDRDRASQHEPALAAKLRACCARIEDYGSAALGRNGRQHYFSRSAPLVSGVRQMAMIAMSE
jgi:hypothetical protein